MRKTVDFIFIVIKLLGDAFLIASSFILAYFIKFKLITLDSYLSGRHYLDVLSFIIFIWLSSFALFGLYKERKGFLSEVDEVLAIFKSCLIGTIMITAFSFFYTSFPESRWVVFYALIISFFLISLFRIFLLFIQKTIKSKGIMCDKALIIGADTLGQSIATKILIDPILGYRLVGFLANQKPQEISFYLKNKLNILGKINDYKAIIQANKIDVVFLALPSLDNETMIQIADFCAKINIKLKTVPNLFELMASSVDITDLDGIPLISLKDSPLLNTLNVASKRIFDVLLSALGLFILAPIFIIVLILVKITSKGPIFYLQERVGLNGKIFNLIKFRSMKQDAEKETGPIITNDETDTRITKIGKFIRRTSLDEIPQLFNVLKGDMSIVGPRPERPFFVDKFIKEIPNFSSRHKIKGGITGWAQINGRAELTEKPEEKLRYDLYYLENWNLLFDMKIILKTIKQVLLQDNIY